MRASGFGRTVAASIIAGELTTGWMVFSAIPAAAQTASAETLARAPYAAPFLPPPREIENGLELSGHLDVETVSAVSGGVSGAAVPTAVLQVGGALDTAAAHLWPGGRWELSLLGVKTGGDLAAVTGALQLPSNIWAPDVFRLYQLTYRQTIGPAYLRFGVMDLNYYFDTTAVAAQLANASFGISPTLTANAPIATFPNPGLGLMGDIKWGDGWSARAGIWQGNPPQLARALRDGAQYLGEIQRSWKERDGNKPFAVIKLGGWHYASSDPDQTPSTGGGYGIGECRWQGASGPELAAFLQLGVSPGKVNPVPYYLAGGTRITGMLPRRPLDILSLGVARAWLRGLADETVWEVNYSAQVGSGIYLQPDLQWIQNPGGINPDALVVGLRLHLEL